MSISTISFDVDSELKRKAENIFKEFGLNMTSAMNMFLEKIVDNKEILFDFEEEIPNEETKLALAEYDEMIKNPEKYKRYDSFKEAMEDVFTEDEEI